MFISPQAIVCMQVFNPHSHTGLSVWQSHKGRNCSLSPCYGFHPDQDVSRCVQPCRCCWRREVRERSPPLGKGEGGCMRAGTQRQVGWARGTSSCPAPKEQGEPKFGFGEAEQGSSGDPCFAGSRWCRGILQVGKHWANPTSTSI